MTGRRMPVHGWQYRFTGRPWSELGGRYDELTVAHPQFSYLAEVVRSIRDSEAAGDLVGTTSMHDLVIASAPPSEPPLEVIVVRAPSSLRPPKDKHVIVEHRSLTGHDDHIERPANEAVPLFWRFVIEKFGILPRP